MDQYKTGDTIKIHKKNKEIADTWLLLGIKRMATSGQVALRVRHMTGWSGHIMIHDIAKIEPVKKLQAVK